MMSKSGKCNVCATPCGSCVRLGPELLPSGSTSNCSMDEACRHKVVCQLISQTAAASSLECEESILESNNDENSCVRGARPGISSEYYEVDMDKKNEAMGSVIINKSVQQRAAQTFDFEPASCCLADCHSEVDDGSHSSDSSKKQGIISSFVKSECNELSGSRDSNARPTSIKGRLQTSSRGYTVSSSSIIMERDANKDSKKDVTHSAKTIKVECVEDSRTELLDCPHQETKILSNESSNVDKPCQFSELVGLADESAFFDDVKVCDICGDAGREDLLAVCSECNDGAEHIYCMRTMVDKVPDSSWICEECMVSEANDKMTKSKFEKSVAGRNYKSSYQTYEGGETSKGSDVKVYNKGLDFEKSRGEKVSSLPSAERTSRTVASVLETKAIAFGGKSKSTFISRESKPRQAQNLRLKPGHEWCAPDDPSSRTRSIQQKAPLPTVLGQILPKSHVATGNLTKSKSFNDSDKRPKVLWLDELPRNQFSKETCNKKKGSTFRTMGKSLSFNDANFGRLSKFGQKTKRISPKLSEDCDKKRLRYMKEDNLVEILYASDFKRPQVCSPKDVLHASASLPEKKFVSHHEMILPEGCGSKYHDARAAQSPRDSGTATASEAKKLCLSVTNVDKDVLLPIGSDASQEVKHKSETTSHFSLKSGMPVSHTYAVGEDKLTLERSWKEAEKVTSSFTCTTDLISNGSGSECCARSESLTYAPQCQLVESSSVSVLDVAMVENENGNSLVDLGSRFCSQLDAYRTLAVPVIDYLWKGEFEFQSSQRLPRVSYRIQAHLSTRASPRIPEAVKKFSDKLLLEEVSRSNAWPTQFQKYHPQDDSIGLYFFAEDISSYGNYKTLLKCLVDYDLALRRNLGRIELLIFSSHLLPKSSQYWNGLLFLWGVFKERKVNCL